MRSFARPRAVVAFLAPLAVVACLRPHAGMQSAAVQGGTVVVLVRHAEKDTAPGADPVLSAAGAARAATLAARPEVAGATAAYATQFRRTQQTAAPVAARRRFATTVMPIAGDADAYAATLAADLRGRPAGDTVLVVGHSNTITHVIAALGGPRLPDLADSEYSRLFVVTLAADGTAALRETSYGLPTAATANAAATSAAAGAMTPPRR